MAPSHRKFTPLCFFVGLWGPCWDLCIPDDLTTVEHHRPAEFDVFWWQTVSNLLIRCREVDTVYRRGLVGDSGYTTEAVMREVPQFQQLPGCTGWLFFDCWVFEDAQKDSPVDSPVFGDVLPLDGGWIGFCSSISQWFASYMWAAPNPMLSHHFGRAPGRSDKSRIFIYPICIMCIYIIIHTHPTCICIYI